MLFAMLNGEIIEREDVVVSVSDRGFRFGDGIFTTIAMIESVPIFWQSHLERLKLGLKTLHIKQNIDHLLDDVRLVIEKNKITTGLLRIIITRGSGSRGYLPTNQTSPTIFIELENITPPISNLIDNPSFVNSPVTLQTSQWRKPPANCIPNGTKTLQGMNPILAKIEAIEAGYNDALMLSYDGFISEATGANIFWLEGDELCTAPLATGCLNGVMRTQIMELFKVSEKLITTAQLQQNSAFLSNCNSGIIPIKSVDGKQLKDATSVKQYQKAIQAKIRQEIIEFV